MDGRGGCCIARCAGGGGLGWSYGMSKVERIMLKFRPIAPKPASAGSVSSGSTMENSDGHGRTRRGKRKYVRSNGNKKKKHTTTSTHPKKRKVSASSSSVAGGGDAVVTLSLMPETPDRKEKLPGTSSPSENSDLLLSVPTIKSCNKPTPIWLNFNNNQQNTDRDGHVASVTDHTVVTTPPPQLPPVVSFVTVECVTDTWINTDEARVMNMESDTCPAFITDGGDAVVWMNKAYREMAAGGGGGSDETVVVLVKKDNQVTLPECSPAFTCKVRVTWGSERSLSPSTLTAPCDVWRLQSGGCAWRLDVNAALCLGR